MPKLSLSTLTIKQLKVIQHQLNTLVFNEERANGESEKWAAYMVGLMKVERQLQKRAQK